LQDASGLGEQAAFAPGGLVYPRLMGTNTAAALKKPWLSTVEGNLGHLKAVRHAFTPISAGKYGLYKNRLASLSGPSAALKSLEARR
jgi:hypothetical protein